VNDLLSVAKVADLAGVSRQTVYNWIKSGKLKTIGLGHFQKVSQEELDGFLASYKPVVRGETDTSTVESHEGATG